MWLSELHVNSENALCVDLGSTHFKCAIAELGPHEPKITSIVTVISDQAGWATSLDGTRRCEQAASAILREANRMSKLAPPAVISLTGVREGVALVRQDGTLIRAIGNAEALMRRSQHGSAWFTRLCYDEIRDPAVVTSLAGWLATRLGAELTISASETSSWPLLMPCAGSKVELAPVVTPGTVIGGAGSLCGAPVVLAGTDEHASQYGAGLGRGRDVALSVSTYWALSRTLVEAATPPHIRRSDPVGPYVGTMSYIGFRWGEYLDRIERGLSILPHSTRYLPEWSVSRFVDAVQKGRLNENAATQLVVDDLIDAGAAIGFNASPNIVVHGGGLRNSIVQRILEATGWSLAHLSVDASILGSALIARRAIGTPPSFSP